MSGFNDDLRAVINAYGREAGSDTPDFILAQFLSRCLDAWDEAMARSREWYDCEAPTDHPGFDDEPTADGHVATSDDVLDAGTPDPDGEVFVHYDDDPDPDGTGGDDV